MNGQIFLAANADGGVFGFAVGEKGQSLYDGAVGAVFEREDAVVDLGGLHGGEDVGEGEFGVEGCRGGEVF